MQFILQNIKPELKEQLLNTPALLSIYTANHNGKLTENEIHAAIDYNKAKTYASPVFLQDFFKEVTADLKEKIAAFEAVLPDDKSLRHEIIKDELQPVREYLDTLDEQEASQVKKVLLGFVEHIYYSEESIFEDVLFPIISSHLNGRNIKNLEKGLL